MRKDKEATKEYNKKWSKENADWLLAYGMRPEVVQRRREASRKYYQAHKEACLVLNHNYRTVHKEELAAKKKERRNPYLEGLASTETNHCLKIEALIEYSNPWGNPICNNCGEQDVDVLCIDHINNNGSEHRKTYTGNLSRWLRDNKYPTGFQVLCWNCNHKKAIPFVARKKKIVKTD